MGHDLLCLAWAPPLLWRCRCAYSPLCLSLFLCKCLPSLLDHELHARAIHHCSLHCYCTQCPRGKRGNPTHLPHESLRETKTQIFFVAVGGSASQGKQTFLDVCVGGEQSLLPAVNTLLSRGTHSLGRPALQEREPTGSRPLSFGGPSRLCSPQWVDEGHLMGPGCGEGGRRVSIKEGFLRRCCLRLTATWR